GAAGSLGGDQDPADRPHPAVERELPDGRMTRKRVEGNLTGGGCKRKRNWKVEAAALLLERGRSEVDRDPALGPAKLAGAEAAAQPFLCLLTGAVGQPDDLQTGQRRLPHVDLDLDPPRLEADEGMRDRPPEPAS